MSLDHLRHLSVIYAEDNDFTRLLYAEMLHSITSDLRLADNGETALSLYQNRPCDLLITDLQMPDVDGLQLCQQLRQQNPDLPVVIVSCHDQSDLLLQTANLGVDGYLLKPIELESLTQILLKSAERLFARRKLEQAALYWSKTFDAIPDLVSILDHEYRVLNMNRAAQQHLGLTLQDAVGQDYCGILHPDGQVPGDCARRRHEEGCCMHATEEPVAMLGGYFSVTVTSICDEKGIDIGRVHVARNVTEKTETEIALRYISTHDQLTGIGNRSWFEAEFNRLISSRCWPVSIIATDLDGLKEVNDTFGHGAGDELIIRAAAVLVASCRGDEKIFRVGGDEFIILLPGINEPEALAIVNRIRNKIAHEEETSPCLSMSLGVAVANIPEQLNETLKRADQRMYQDKMHRKTDRSVTCHNQE